MQIGDVDPKENSNANHGRRSLMTVASEPDESGNQYLIQVDADNKTIEFRRVDADGATVTAAGRVVIDMGALSAVALDLADGLTAEFQETVVCVVEDGTPVKRYAMVLMAGPYGTPPT